MKLSSYNYEENNGDNYILYNCRTDELLFLNEELRGIWLDNSQSRLEKIGEIHPEFFSYLVSKGFVVSDTMDEQAAVLSKFHGEDNSEEVFSIIVNPTLDCNMRCWYCYEKHQAKAYMTKEMMDRILKLAKDKVSNPKLKTFAVSFFGGEPLMAFDDCVYPMLGELDKLCVSEKKMLTVAFTSNAFLLNDGMISKLKTLHLARPIDWQITIDGGRDLHNRTRHTVDKQGTYDVIVGNILRALAAGMNVTVRFNYQNKSILSFLDVIDSFKEYADVYRGRLCFSFHQVWQDVSQCGNAKTQQDTLLDVKRAFEDAGLSALEGTGTPVRCYADSPNSIVINYDGNIFKCTARDFKEDSAEGVLNADGTVCYNSKYEARMNARYANKTCLDCIIYPLCFGVCSQKLIYNGDKCSRGFGKDDVMEFVRQRILQLAGRI